MNKTINFPSGNSITFDDGEDKVPTLDEIYRSDPMHIGSRTGTEAMIQEQARVPLEVIQNHVKKMAEMARERVEKIYFNDIGEAMNCNKYGERLIDNITPMCHHQWYTDSYFSANKYVTCKICGAHKEDQ